MLFQFLSRLRFSRKSSAPSRRRPAKTNKVRLSVELLEDRVVASANPINYLSLPTGTYSYNNSTGALKQITSARPSMMVSNGATMDAVFGNGIFSYDYSSNKLTQLTGAIPTTMDLGSPYLYASFNSGGMKGTYVYNGSWHPLNNKVAFKIAAVGPGIFYEFVGGDGLYEYQSYNNSLIKQTIPAGTSAFYTMGVSGSSVVLSFNTGTYVNTYNGWNRISTSYATQIAMIGTGDFYATFSNGNTQRWTNGQMVTNFGTGYHAIAAGSAGYNATVFVGAFSTGTWTYLNGKWKEISTSSASLIA